MAGYSCPVEKQNVDEIGILDSLLEQSFYVYLNIKPFLTSVVYKYISIEPISEKNNVLLIFKTDVSPCEEMGVKTEMTRMACNTNMIGEMLSVCLRVRQIYRWTHLVSLAKNSK